MTGSVLFPAGAALATEGLCCGLCGGCPFGTVPLAGGPDVCGVFVRGEGLVEFFMEVSCAV
jgi:hypothetical protein